MEANSAAAAAPAAAAAAAAAAPRGARGNVKAKPAGATRGTAASHRPWKTVQAQKFSSMSRPKATGGAKRGRAFNEQQARKSTVLKARAQLTQLREVRAAELKAKRERAVEKQRRRAENELKGASYQVISNPEKLKRMTKKQLRQVKKTRVNKDGVTELVPAYAR